MTLPGANVLLIGPAGTGKTHSLGTAVDWAAKHGMEVFCEFLESGMESLLGYWTDRGLDVPRNLHWHHLKMVEAGSGFGSLLSKAEDIGRYGDTALFKIEDNSRQQRNYFAGLIKQCINFHDDRTGQDFGSVSDWKTNRLLAIDGLTGITLAAWSMTIGNKPTKSQADWLRTQDSVEGLLRKLCDSCPCHFILLGHVERETDQITGGTKVTVSAPGKALAPKIPVMFSDVILAQRNATKFTWSTANQQTDLKTRNLAIADNLDPNFGVILDKWVSRGGKLE